MAPRYAPSLRSRLGPLLLFLQTGFILIYAFYFEIQDNVVVDEAIFRDAYAGESHLIWDEGLCV